MYRSVLSAGLLALVLHGSAQSYVHQVLVLNEGYFDFFGGGGQLIPVSLGSYDPGTGSYQTVATLVGPRFASDVIVDGSSIYVAADDRVMRFDANSYLQTGETLVQGVRKLAIWNDQLLVTRGELGGLTHYFEVRDKNTLDLLYTVSPSDGLTFSAEDVLVVEDKAYLAVSNAFEWGSVVGRVGAVDLLTGAYGDEVDLGPDGTNPERLMLYEGDIIAFNNKDFNSSSISRVGLASGTLTYTNNISLNSGCAASAMVGAVDKVYFMEYAQNELARYDLASATVSDTLSGSPAVYGLIEDPLNNVLYATTTDFFSTGDLHVLDLNGQVLSTLPVGVAPGNLALDVRASTGLNEVSGLSLAAYPNPAEHVLTITGVRNGAQVRILDATGRLVLTARNANADRIIMEVDGLRSGIYTVEVIGQGVVRFTKA